MRATMDLLTLYQEDNTLLDLMEVPEALDNEVLKDNLLMETAELELLYPNPVFLKMAIGSWSKKQLHVWEELYDTTQYEYNPIWNKDGTISELITRNLATTEDVTDDNTRTDNLTDLQTRDATDTRTDNLTDLQTRDATDTTTNNLTDEQTRDLAGTSDSTTTRNVYGFNGSTATPAEQTIQDVDTTDTGTITDEHTGTQTDAHTGTITDSHTGTQTDAHTGTITDAHTGTQTDNRIIDRDTTDTGTINTLRTEQGNIGLTSTQQLIQEQREVVKLNLYDIIIRDFIDRFCLRLY